MQMGRRRAGVAGRADVADAVAAIYFHAFGDALFVAVQMSVIVAVIFRGIELVDGQAAGLAGEKLANRAVIDGDDGCAAGRHDVRGFMGTACIAILIERVPDVSEPEPGY